MKLNEWHPKYTGYWLSQIKPSKCSERAESFWLGDIFEEYEQLSPIRWIPLELEIKSQAEDTINYLQQNSDGKREKINLTFNRIELFGVYRAVPSACRSFA